MTHLINSRTDWTEALLQETWGHIEDVALNDLKLDYYAPQIEIISAEQMIDAYSSVGLPVHYNHWSYGKAFMRDWAKYQKGQMGLAYEIVINTNPCISYLMEENNMVTQALVMAHAAAGHSHFFKNNYLFKEWTSAGSIIDYMMYAKNYIAGCEEKYGEAEVEAVLDAAHALSAHGVDKSKRRHKKRLTVEEQLKKDVEKADEEQKNLDIVLKRMRMVDPVEENDEEREVNEENLLYFIFKRAPNMEQWKRELLRIVYKVAQYFYPQGQTKTGNEGFATHTHFYIMNELEKRGVLSPDAQLSWLHQHSGVVWQRQFDNRYYDGFNPYALGFAMFKDIRRICEEPTKEDEQWFPNLVGTDWREAHKEAVADYRDESFIQQYLSPKLIREWNLFSVTPKPKEGYALVRDVSDPLGYNQLRQDLGASYARINHVPEIVVSSADMKTDRTLKLKYRPYANKQLYKPYVEKTLRQLKFLWGYDVELKLN